MGEGAGGFGGNGFNVDIFKNGQKTGGFSVDIFKGQDSGGDIKQNLGGEDSDKDNNDDENDKDKNPFQNQSGNNSGGSQGNWMADIANAQKDAWTKYIDTAHQAPQMGMPAASTQKTGSAQQNPERAEKISAIKDYIDAATRASELKQQQQEVDNADQQRPEINLHPAEK